ncbi:hypothetical protein PTRA_b0192 [Pseudoalteromonas translucida KMM 520]|uniref:G domain-containing protein n=1 Tax=Pseudoalteromonas translucida KMM 520 TaxID=1315283 RepID=A0A0U2WI46_9GAMM|nr:YtxH domain-containing protein [Pseudoalteromonas translucida]ALS34711.1 hypothetical protein PTRA_b0192 [Pseudoalteromonas translucida KMM 520]
MNFDTDVSMVTPSGTPKISGDAKKLNKKDLVNETFTKIDLLVDSFKDVIDSHSMMFRTDGTIIGTGKADFTQGNTTYVLSNSGKKFHLIDVPGIEGNESKYETMVKQAVAKAHLVFYVNGTNKKPEKVTAEKIKSYLNRGTQVCPLLNVRGNADSYEFEEDRISLSNEHNNTGLLQTTEVLEQCIGKKRLLPAYCVQGLLAFSSLAKTEQNISTIHSSRQNDLIIQQRNFLKHFHKHEAMQEFSGIKNIANVLESKAATFREDIVESNKEKVKELLNEKSSILNSLLFDYRSFFEKIKPEFSACEASINDKFYLFKQSLCNGRRNLLEQFFSNLANKADDIVEDNFGDEDSISRQLKLASNEGQENLVKEFSEHFKKCVDVLLEDLKTAMLRLIEDIQRVEFQTDLEKIKSLDKVNFQTSEIEMGFDLKDFGKFAFNIASYALSGFAIGTAFPGIGNIVGAIAGAVVGILSSLLSVFTSKAKRIRKAQSKVQSRIDDARDSALNKVTEDLEQVVNDVSDNIISPIKEQVDLLQKSVNDPIEIINQQIKIMANLSEKVEAMPYGTIQAI